MPFDATDTIALDVHAHLIPINEELLGKQDGVRWREDGLVVDGKLIGPSALFDPRLLLAWMDKHHVGQAWISIPPPAYRQNLPVEAARAWLRYVNEGLKQISSRYPQRLVPLHYLPLEHPVLALEMAAHAIDQGHARFCVAAGGHERIVYSDPALERLWTLLDEASSFVFIHPGHCCDDRLNPFYLRNLIGNPHETAVAVSHLIFSGVCDRFGNIAFCLAHGGGTVPMLAGRLSRGYASGRPGIAVDDIGGPDAYLKNFVADCIVHDEYALRLAAHVFGNEHLIFGSDWPFQMGLPDPHAQLKKVDSVMRRQVLQDNAKLLLASSTNAPRRK